jgi:hypothetical protein
MVRKVFVKLNLDLCLNLEVLVYDDGYPLSAAYCLLVGSASACL